MRARRTLALLIGAIGVLALGTTTGAGASTPPAGPTTGKVTLTIGVIQDVDSPNVTAGYLVSSFELYTMQYATLTDKAAADFATEPGLAESWTASADKLSYTYKLRAGLTWSDGQPLTADDVAWTINTSRDQAWINHTATTTNLTAEVVDDRTVKITSSVPDPKLPTMDAYILPKHIWGKLSAADITTYDGLDGVGSGPFTLTDRKAGQSWTMTANPNYYAGRRPIDQVVFRVFTNADAMVAALQKGEVDAIDDVPTSSFEALSKDASLKVVVGQQGSFGELGMNNMANGIGDGNPALLNLDVRHAIAHAIDRKALLDRVLGGQGLIGSTLEVSPDSPWMPNIPVDKQYNYDPEAAKALLDKAGYRDGNGDGTREGPDGKALVLRFAERSESEIASPIRELITGWLKAIGIGTEVSVYDDKQLTDQIGNGTYDLFVWGWTPFVDPDPMLSYFTSSQLTTDVASPGYNDANWTDPEFDKLYEQQKVELDRAKRIEIVHQMLALFYEQTPYVVLLVTPDIQAYRTDRFEGWTQQPAKTGPVLFTNSSPTYINLKPIGGGGSSDGGTSTGLVIGLVAGALVLLGGGLAFARRSRSTQDDRE